MVLLIIILTIGSLVEMKSELFPRIKDYAISAASEFDKIDANRKLQLEELSEYIQNQLNDNKNAKLTFICTHNSRRSHIAQLWAVAAAEYYDIKNIESYSGGTEATAFNTRSVAALKRAGFEIETVKKGDNPEYSTKYANDKSPVIGFSKKFSDKANPDADFAAIMVCSDADEACPYVIGASDRIAIPYEDPNKFDNTDKEVFAYDERTRQIAREILYVFSKVKAK